MPRIIIRCPATLKPIPTGLTTDALILSSMPPDLKFSLKCPVCRRLHEWKKCEAWVENEGA